jgi:RNA polymerase sigma-70 factor (ECF subfamily)
MKQPEDGRLAALMREAQRGDAAAYRAVLSACVPVASAMARRQGVQADRIDDVVQDVLLTVHRARATYDPTRPFLPWLRAIAQRRAIDALRSHGRHGGHEVHDELAYLNHADAAAEAGTMLDQQADSTRLRGAIETLPAGQRQAVELLGLRERTLDEAALATGRSKGALKVNLHRALKALRGRLAEGGDD